MYDEYRGLDPYHRDRRSCRSGNVVQKKTEETGKRLLRLFGLFGLFRLPPELMGRHGLFSF